MRITINIGSPRKSRDAYEEGKHPRAEDGKFGSGSTATLRTGHKAVKSDAGNGNTKYEVTHEKSPDKHEFHLGPAPERTLVKHVITAGQGTKQKIAGGATATPGMRVRGNGNDYLESAIRAAEDPKREPEDRGTTTVRPHAGRPGVVTRS